MNATKTTTATATATLAVLLAAGQAAAQSTIRVPGDAATIQQAVDRAADGDTILVAAGRYNEAVDAGGLAFTLRGEAGAAATVLDASGTGLPALATRGDVTLEGFTLTGAGGPWAALDAQGATLVIADTVFEGNGNRGLNALLSDVTLRDVGFVGNDASGNGGALLVLGGGLTIDGAQFRGNTGRGLGGAVYVGQAVLDARGIEAVGNGVGEVLDGGARRFSTFGGGAVYTTGVRGRIDASRFVGNIASFGGGLYIAGGERLEVTNTLVAGSLTSLGAIYANASAPLIANCTIVNNDDWGLFTTRGGTPTVRNSVFSGNEIYPRSIEIGGPGVADVAFTLINGTASATLGAGVVTADPLLDDDLAPLPGSPAIDAGDNAALPAGITTDLVGGARFVDDPATPDTGAGTAPIVDLGAIEFAGGQATPCAADLDADGELTLFDFLMFQNLFDAGSGEADFDADGELTLFDFLAFQNAFDAGCA